MKKIILMIALTLCIGTMVNAQNVSQAEKVLDKTAEVIGHRGGAKASFSVNNEKLGAINGTIAIKGNKFHASTGKATIWYNGKTQWTYLQKTNEVNVSTPTQAKQMLMNPYTFIHIYKTGYSMGMTNSGDNYLVHLTAQNQKRTVQELYILINKSNYVPKQIRMREGKAWTTINVSNFQTQNLSNSLFAFNSKDFPSAEVVDLR